MTQSRGLGDLLGNFLRSRPDLVVAAPDLQIKISGCPNGCGLHHIAGIGFQGGMRKVGTQPVPQAEPEDYVDLAEETEFHAQIQEGECSA